MAYNLEDCTFLVQRQGIPYSCLGKDLYKDLQLGDKFLVQRGDQPFYWEAQYREEDLKLEDIEVLNDNNYGMYHFCVKQNPDDGTPYACRRNVIFKTRGYKQNNVFRWSTYGVIDEKDVAAAVAKNPSKKDKVYAGNVANLFQNFVVIRTSDGTIDCADPAQAKIRVNWHTDPGWKMAPLTAAGPYMSIAPETNNFRALIVDRVFSEGPGGNPDCSDMPIYIDVTVEVLKGPQAGKVITKNNNFVGLLDFKNCPYMDENWYRSPKWVGGDFNFMWGDPHTDPTGGMLVEMPIGGTADLEQYIDLSRESQKDKDYLQFVEARHFWWILPGDTLNNGQNPTLDGKHIVFDDPHSPTPKITILDTPETWEIFNENSGPVTLRHVIYDVGRNHMNTGGNGGPSCGNFRYLLDSMNKDLCPPVSHYKVSGDYFLYPRRSIRKELQPFAFRGYYPLFPSMYEAQMYSPGKRVTPIEFEGMGINSEETATAWMPSGDFKQYHGDYTHNGDYYEY